MKRRALLRWMAATSALLPLHRIRLFAQPRDLTPEAVAVLQDIAPTVLPSSLGAAGVRAIVDKVVV